MPNVFLGDESGLKASEGGGDVGGDGVGEEAVIFWPELGTGQAGAGQRPRGACSFRELPPPPPPIPAEQPVGEPIPLPKSCWGKACLKAVEGHRRLSSQGSIEEEPSIVEWMRCLDLKLDALSAQVTEALPHAAFHHKRHRQTVVNTDRSMVYSSRMCHSIWSSGGSHEDPEGPDPRLADVISPQEGGGLRSSVASSQRGSVRSTGRRNAQGRRTLTDWIATRQRKQGRVSREVWFFLDNPESSCAAHLYNELMPGFILLSVILSLVYAITPGLLSTMRIAIAEIAIETIFLSETCLRFAVCPNRWKFFTSAFNIIDILSVLPLFVRLVLIEHPWDNSMSFGQTVLICFVPALRLLRTWRRFKQVHLLAKAFKLAFEALPVMLFIYMVVWLFFTAALFVAEERNNLPTLVDAMWLTFCSLTSATFGDVYPQTAAGKIIISHLVLTSILYLAIPIGIIGSCFSEVWANRHKVLLVERMRSVFKQNGFKASDIPRLFSYFDQNDSGRLGLEEFTSLASTLQLGISEGHLVTLFQMFDDDGSGGIDEQEFCRTFFPEEHSLLYGN